MNPAPTSARAYAWERMRALYRENKAFSLNDLIASVGKRGKAGDRSNLRKYLSALVAHGALEIIETKNGKASRYRMLRNLGPTSPVLRSDGAGLTDPNAMRVRPPRTEQRPGSFRALAWKAIRVFGQRRARFTALDVAVLMAKEGDQTLSDLRRYLAALAMSGHLETEGDSIPRVYRVARDTGPLYPIMRRNGTVYDPNEQREYECGEPA